MDNEGPEILFSRNNLKLTALLVLEFTHPTNEPSQAFDPVAKDCMAAKGCIQVPEGHAEAKIQELDAANAKRQAPELPSRKIAWAID